MPPRPPAAAASASSSSSSTWQPAPVSSIAASYQAFHNGSSLTPQVTDPNPFLSHLLYDPLGDLTAHLSSITHLLYAPLVSTRLTYIPSTHPSIHLPIPMTHPQLVASTVLVSARLARLKAEMVNVLYMLPEKPMRWIESAATLSEVGAWLVRPLVSSRRSDDPLISPHLTSSHL